MDFRIHERKLIPIFRLNKENSVGMQLLKLGLLKKHHISRVVVKLRLKIEGLTGTLGQGLDLPITLNTGLEVATFRLVKLKLEHLICIKCLDS